MKINPPIGRVNWGTGIVITFIVFMAITLSTVVYLMNQDVDLVADNYYEKEIKYQQQIDKVERTSLLEEKPSIIYDGNAVTIGFPSKLMNKELTGEIFCYRPSSPLLDFKVVMQLDENGKQIIPAEKLEKGYWRFMLDWKFDGKDYYNEEMIFIN